MDNSFLTRAMKKPEIYLLILAMLGQLLTASAQSPVNDRVLMVINDREITSSEFIRMWEKNSMYTDQQPLDEYLEMFLRFQLKVAHARDKELHLENSFIRELDGYRKKLAEPYMTVPETEEKLLKEAYERMLYTVNASHILVRLMPDFNPEDTLRAWEKAISIRERILGGESFEVVARATSDDPSAKSNSGDLNYFTVFQMVYPFENHVYQAEIGELSMPVRSRFGYHIIRVNDIRESKGEVKTAHIMFGFNKYGESEAKEKAMKMYEDLLGGYNFSMMAEEHSTDQNSAASGGELPWFGVGRLVPEFEEVAFALKNQGDISEPVRTAYGWHIIKLIDNREVPGFDDIRQEMITRIRDSRDERSRLINNALVKKLKQEWEFSENTGALEIFYGMVDESIFSGNWTPPPGIPLNQTLFSITGNSITQRHFAEFLAENAPRRKPWPIEEYLWTLYEEFVSRWLIDHEAGNLENKHPEFRLLMQEYKDGMLLFEITEQEVWSKAKSDTAGLKDFYEQNKSQYMWDTRVVASIFSTEDNRTAKRTARRARRSSWFASRDNSWITDRLNRSHEEDVVTVESGLFAKGDNNLIDRMEWTNCKTGLFREDGGYRIILVHEVLDPETKTMDEARGQVIVDYQDYLEDIWVEGLRNKYNVTINREVLSTIE